MRLIDFFDRGAALNPDGPCFSGPTEDFTYAEVHRATNRIANGLLAAGLSADAVVATITPNDIRALLPALGALRAGGIWLPINARYARDEIVHSLVANDCDFVFFHSSLDGDVVQALPRLPRLKGIVCIDTPLGAAPSLQDWMVRWPDTEVDVARAADDVAAIRGTGGTTGPSRGVMLTNENYETLFACLYSTLPMLTPPVNLAAAPLSHAAGTLCFATMVHGGRNVILPRFDPAAVLEAIERFEITHMFLTPTMLYMLIDHPQARSFNYSSLRYVIYAGAPISSDKLRQAIEIFGPVLAQSYGQAEAPFFCTVLTPAEHVVGGEAEVARRLASCGRATPFVRLAIMDDDGRILPPGERGEIVVRSTLVMKGYYNNPDATARVSRHGWHHTGDVGYLDSEGYLHIVDRLKDMIISGGFNLYPSEIEQVIWSHPAVHDCAVVGVPDETWGESVKAVVQLKPGAHVSADDIIQLCSDRLGRMKAPRSVEFWDDLPRSIVGKVLKREIRDRFWKASGRAI